MIDRTCYICKEYVNDVWTLVISDDKDKFEISGHKSHIDEINDKVSKVKDLHKKPVNKVVKEVGLD